MAISGGGGIVQINNGGCENMPLDSGTLQVCNSSSGTAFGGGPVALAGSDLAFNPPAGSSGTLSPAGGSILCIEGPASPTLATSFSGGTLVNTGAGMLTPGGSVLATSGSIGGGQFILSGNTACGGATLGGGTFATLVGPSLTPTGSDTPSFALTVESGVQQLPDGFCGAININGGTVDAAGAAAEASIGLVSLNGGGQLVFGSGAGIGALLAASSPVGASEIALSAAAPAPAAIENNFAAVTALGGALPRENAAGIAIEGPPLGGIAPRQAVPEPATIVLLAAAALCAAAIRRRRGR